MQPLVAATVLPLDGRVNVNVAGNYNTTTNRHESHDGFAAYEINPQKVLINPPNSVTTRRVIPPTPFPPNTPESQVLVHHRYGNNYRPSSAPWRTR